MSAPTVYRERDGADEAKPRLRNFSAACPAESNSTVEELLLTACLALGDMMEFRENYTCVTFGTGYDLHVKNTKFHDSYDWLPSKEEVPKHLGEDVHQAHIQSLKLHEFLKNAFEYTEKYAVGIQQVLLDQEVMNGDFSNQFRKIESNLKEFLELLSRAGIKSSKTVDSTVMDQSIRKMTDTAHRNLRDWIIFRECMNGMEYFIQVLTYFKNLQGS